ncbi:protein tincar [Aplysia californica]|uniref:Protein tincar n=1 Tax=Aplysia californica TaxID=6500 RepID=A0ABM1A2H1_APLCA|nr:protein tincar [Aplysia californica]XP_035826350.1 protein tincar [Aplysia californica]XP_035826351.1 protein tincar [Aplysia californica]
MIGMIARRSSLNSFGSICYCLITLGVHAYASYTAISRYKESQARAWPGAKGKPVESGCLLGLTILSLVLMPVFCVTSFFRVGNLANDGVKLGRDHALGGSSADPDKGENAPETTATRLKRVWRHFCPLSQSLHVIAAFLLMLPETLLTAVEVKYEYKSTDTSWLSQLDFLFPPERAFMSDVRSIVNISEFSNATHVFLPTPRAHVDWKGDQVTVSIAFANFCFALTCFLVRYASVFWFTNKALTLVFALQLLAMVINSIFSFNCFSILYCVCYNRKKYPNVTLSIACSVDLILYLFGSLILMVSTTSVFEYGSHYFHEKFKIVERHHNPESYVKQTVVVNNGCQGYVAHVCAMAALIVFAVCKGPLLYDLVSLMRLTDDQLLLSGVVCEVCYMVLWVALWFGLTIKQQWQFRILDYVPLKQPPRGGGGGGGGGSEDSASVRSSQTGQGETLDVAHFIRNKRLAPGRESVQRYSDPLPIGVGANEEQSASDVGTDESDIGNNVDVVLDLDGNPLPDPSGHFRRPRHRRLGGQRVTFDESVRSKGSGENERQTSSLPRHVTYGHRGEDNNHVNVTADVHSITPPLNFQTEDSSQEVVKRRNSGAPENTMSREYRNSIRNKCGEYYASANNLTASPDDPVPLPNPSEPLPTLMSSFRDKVRESSIAASNFKEREKNMLEHYNNYADPPSPPPPNPMQEAELNDAEKRRCIALSDEALGQVDYNNRLQHPAVLEDNSLPGDPHGEVIYGRDASLFPSASHRPPDIANNTAPSSSSSSSSSSAFSRKKHNVSLSSSDEGHRSSFANTTVDSSELSLPPLLEDIQLGRIRSNSSSGGGAGQRKEDYHHQHHHQNHHPHHDMNGSIVHTRQS